MRRELARYFKANIEPITQEDKSLLASFGIKQRPFFKSTKGSNCLVVYAYRPREKMVLKFKSKDNPPFDQRAAEALRKNGIGVIKFYGTHRVQKGLIYSGKEPSFCERKSWAGYDFEISLNASLEALKSVKFDDRVGKGREASKLIASDMRDVGNLAGRLYRAKILYVDFKPANLAKTNRLELFDIHEGNIRRSGDIADHAKACSHYLDIVKYTFELETKGLSNYFWSHAKTSFFEGLERAGKTKPLITILEKLGW